MIVKVVKIINKNEKKSDAEYWRSRPPEERLAALEAIRKEYNDLVYGPDRKFQKVYKIIKRSEDK